MVLDSEGCEPHPTLRELMQVVHSDLQESVSHLPRCHIRRPGGTDNWAISLPSQSLDTNTAQMVRTWLPALIVCGGMVIKTQNNFELCYQGMNRKRPVSHDNLNDTGTFCYCNQAPSQARSKSQLPHIVHMVLLSSQDQILYTNWKWKRNFTDLQNSKSNTWVTASINVPLAIARN